MSKASVAQEPSMDEILASIRRIIETGDDKSTGGNRDAALGVARQIPAFLAGGLSTEARAQHVREPVAVPFASLGTADAAAGDGAFHSLSLDPTDPAPSSGAIAGEDDRLTAELETELAATWERIEVAHGLAQPHMAVSTPHGTEPAGAGSETMNSEPETRSFDDHAHAYASQDVPEVPSPEPIRGELPVDSAQNHEASMERGAFEPANTDTRAEPETIGSSSRYGDTPPPLVSQTTGHLVGASFNELAEAIRQGELRSLEAMAQEMLQPMLRDWLDDNLPQMVERLVREEIERLARGGAKR